MADFNLRPTQIAPFLPGVESPFASAMQGFMQARESKRQQQIQDFQLMMAARNQEFQEAATAQELALREKEGLALADYRMQSLARQSEASDRAHQINMAQLGFAADQARRNAELHELQMLTAGAQAEDFIAQRRLQAEMVNQTQQFADTTLVRFGGLPVSDLWRDPQITTFSHAPDLSARDPEDNGISGIDGKPTHTRAGVALPSKVMKALGISPKKARVRMITDTGDVEDFPVIDRGTAEWVVDRAGRPTLDLTPLAIDRLGGSLNIVDGEIRGVSGVRLASVKLYEADKENVVGEEAGTFGGIEARDAALRQDRAARLQAVDMRPRTGKLPASLTPYEILKQISNVRQMVGNNPSALLPLQKLEQRMRLEDPHAFELYEADNQLRQLKAAGVGARGVALAVNYPGEMGMLASGKPLDAAQFQGIQTALQDLNPGDVKAFSDQFGDEDKQRITANMVKDLNAQWKLATRAQEARAALSQLTDDEFGIYKQRVKEVGVKWGAVHWSTNRNEFEQLRNTLMNTVLKEVSGAAVTDQEFQRFLNQVGNPRELSADNFRQRMNLWLDSLEFDYTSLLRQYRSAGFEIPSSFDPGGRSVGASSTSQTLADHVDQTIVDRRTGEQYRVVDAGDSYQVLDRKGNVMQEENKR